MNFKVCVRIEEIVIPTCLPLAPDKNPMFLEKRVYQGSSGRVYPLPLTDRIASRPVDRKLRYARGKFQNLLPLTAGQRVPRRWMTSVNVVFFRRFAYTLANASSLFSMVRLDVGDVVLDVRRKLGPCGKRGGRSNKDSTGDDGCHQSASNPANGFQQLGYLLSRQSESGGAGLLGQPGAKPARPAGRIEWPGPGTRRM